MKRRVEWSFDALEELKRQIGYIARDNPDAAARIAQRIRSTGTALGDFATGRPGRVRGTYEKSVARSPYIIAYALTKDDMTVSILHVIHSARNWPSDEWPT